MSDLTMARAMFDLAVVQYPGKLIMLCQKRVGPLPSGQLWITLDRLVFLLAVLPRTRPGKLPSRVAPTAAAARDRVSRGYRSISVRDVVGRLAACPFVWRKAELRECPLFRRFGGTADINRRDPLPLEFMSTRPSSRCGSAQSQKNPQPIRHAADDRLNTTVWTQSRPFIGFLAGALT
jgi:hypothetical protein